MKKISIFTLITLTYAFNSCKNEAIDPLPTKGLIGYYNLNGNGRDVNKPSNDGILKNVQATTDRFGREASAFQFNGYSSFIELPEDTFVFKEFTYSAWVKYDEIPFNQSRTQGVFVIINVGNTYGNGDHALCLANTVNLGWGMWTYANPSGNGNSIAEGKLPNDTSTWYHVVATRSKNELKIYVNSKLVASQLHLTGEPAYNLSNVQARIGSRVDGSLTFKGKIDDVRIYNRVLDATEIGQLYIETPK
ncbi:Concanavalin A-like lectin/glucanases superfamily protein [Pseudarcicella hirudinis]|uniref:Concanavalin A-like lectin/glucanases superfamily protein n=1 Tax=Pseudarcicella hirudinis TaxID=1079859 RepID=A0A1I5UCR6_9BACT|nr:LamG domain-containing protein [Pseudarcicella hirudinis]SFP93039.1 Concanavalin A-like lectin/glucanases superfamily protein [Pseudarcicella hirudinis]